MNLEERETVERHFRAGGIVALCSTTTLAMGVNLPVRNVFIEPEKWETSPFDNRPVPMPMKKSDFENMAGRAGRLSHEKEFGRAFLIAGSEADLCSFKHIYIDGEIEALKTHLLKDDLGTIILNLVASGICRDAGGVRNFITNTLSWRIGERGWKFKDEELDKRIAQEIGKCMKSGLIEKNPEGLIASKTGEVCANKGISVNSAINILSWLRRASVRRIDDVEILYVAARSEDAEDYYINMSTPEYHHSGYHRKLERQLDQSALKLFHRELCEPVHRKYEDVKAMKVALVMSEWINETPTVDIESQYNVSSGTIQRVSGGISWIVDAMGGIAFVLDMGEMMVAQLDQISTRLLHGIGADGLCLAGLRVKGLTRSMIPKLVEARITDKESFVSRSQSDLEQIIPGWLVKRILRRLKEGETAEPPRNDIPEAEVKKIMKDSVFDSGAPQQTASDVPIGSVVFKSNDRFHFDGRVEKKRTYIGINGNTVSVTNRSFEFLLKLAVQLKKDSVGWVNKAKLVTENQSQYLSRARKEIAPYLLDGNSEIIENDSYGSYRLSVPPENLSFDIDVLSCHWMHGIKQLSEEIEGVHARV